MLYKRKKLMHYLFTVTRFTLGSTPPHKCSARFAFKYFIVVITVATLSLILMYTELSNLLFRGNLKISDLEKKRSENYWCQIPSINPYNNDVLKFLDKNYKVENTTCKFLNQLTYTENGKLIVKIKAVSDVKMCYIKRKDDFNIDVTTSCQVLMEESVQEYCLVSAMNGKLLNMEDKNKQQFVIIDSGNKQCSSEEKFSFKDGKYIHIGSKKCIQPLEGKSESVLVLHEDCGNNSIFRKTEDKLKHVNSGLCAYFNANDGKIHLIECLKAKEVPFHPLFDINMKIRLVDEFVKISFMHDNKRKEEFHAHVLEPSEPLTKRKENELDILMVMMDSLSNANAQRQLKKSYNFLQQDHNTVILKGHTINGDGTTAQLVGMLTGLAEDKTPEARRGFPGAKTVDDWPFIFKNLHNKSYVTLYSEDTPNWSTFQLRLLGFNKKPTIKYLRPFYQSLPNAESVCNHKLAFKYLKHFLNKYVNYKKFGFLNMGLSHNNMNAFRNIDDDLYGLINYLQQNNYLNKTAMFIFGDHGIRAGGYRKTINGKLEERLPLMTLTLPTWFKERYPRKFSNLRSNGEILTTHYDIHATLLHFLDLDSPARVTNKYEKSLFSEIYKEKRTCDDANIESHWCPCMQYRKVNINSSIIQRLAKKTIALINEKLNAHSLNNFCAPLELSTVQSARVGAHSKTMQRFVHTLGNEQCDSCGYKLDDDIPVKESYELTFTVLPSGGLFESSATVVSLNDNEIIDIKPAISRLNLYGNQPACIAKKFPHLRKYCFCKGQ